jgi:AmmeMemoRadiSam system protein A
MHFFVFPALVLWVFLCSAPGWGGQGAMNYSKAEKELLLRLARSTIEAHLKGQTPPDPPDPPPALSEPRGVFVSLHRQGRLRGCIGYLEPIKPLLAAVQEMAAAAAFRDPRFPPVRPEELADLHLEISVLSPMQRIFKVEEIEVGKHGLYIERGLARGLLLPQVATQYGWDRLTFLEQTCLKAGMPPDAWKDPDTRIYVFTAEVFTDESEKPESSSQEPKAP